MAPKAPKISIPQPPPPSAEETRAQKLGLLGQELAFEQGGFDITEDPETGQLRAVKRAPTPQELQLQELESLGIARAKETLTGEYSPETRSLVKQAFDPARERGMESIRQYAIELAGGRGLNMSDTPVAKEALMAQERLMSNLAGAEAGSLLNLQGRQQEFGAALHSFQQDLQQRALANRLALAGSSGQMGLGLGQQRASLFRPQVMQGSQGFGGNLISGGLGLAGSLGAAHLLSGGGLGLGAAAGLFSSRRFKENIKVLDPHEVLKMIDETPVYTWNYKPEFNDEKTHLGPLTEESPKIMVTADGTALVPLDYMGVLLAAIKGLSEKVKRLEEKNGTTL